MIDLCANLLIRVVLMLAIATGMYWASVEHNLVAGSIGLVAFTILVVNPLKTKP